MILKGNEKGRKATVEKINVDDYNCDIRLVGDKVSSMKGVDYEDISKLAEN